MNEISELVRASNGIGKSKELVQAGGGNTSVKTEDGRMFIKASGFTFSEMTENSGFTVLDYKKISNFFEDYIYTPVLEENEIAYNQSLSKSITNPNSPKPSMESGMHVFLDRVVIHTHPVMVNIITCMNGGKNVAQQLFSDITPEFLWVDYKTPGYNLAKEIKEKVFSYEHANGVKPEVIFLKNHGLIISGNDSSKCVDTTIRINEKIFDYLNNNFGLEPFPEPQLEVKDNYFNNSELVKNFVENLDENKHLLSNFLIPDDAIYCSEFSVQDSLNLEKNKINFVAGQGVFYPWNERKSVKVNEMLTAKLYILMALNKISKIDFLKEEDVTYLLNMESEKYRQKLTEGN